MNAGRKPKPTALKVIQGTYRPDRANLSEPRPRPGIPPCPKFLQGEAREAYRKTAKKLAHNGFFFLVVWELMSLLSYFLVVTEHEKAEARYAGLFYLIMAHVGTAFIILTLLILSQETGSFSFEAFRHPDQQLPEGLRSIAFFTALIGFGAKAGIVPLHVWLPYAHPAAPSHISALMSGVMNQTAIYGLIRVYFDFMGGEFPWWWGFTLLVAGTVSALLGVMYALMEHDLKSLPAFHSVENIGIILPAG